jgi:hypothetical protein
MRQSLVPYTGKHNFGPVNTAWIARDFKAVCDPAVAWRAGCDLYINDCSSHACESNTVGEFVCFSLATALRFNLALILPWFTALPGSYITSATALVAGLSSSSVRTPNTKEQTH